MVRLLCESRQAARDDEAREQGAEGYREALQVLCLALQETGGTALPVDAACEVLRQAGKARDVKAAATWLDRLTNRTGLLRVETRDGEQVIRPWHRSFQEYLAARQIAVLYTNRAEACTTWLGERLTNPSWTGCLRFLVGAFGQVDTQHALRCVESWLDAAHPGARREARMLALAAGGTAEYDARHFQGQPLRERLRQEIAARYAERGADWPWEDRLDALLALGRLGDPRLPDPRHIQTWTPQTGWAQVHDRLWIRVWPVTVAEYAAFVAAGGAEPDNWPTQLRGPNRPVVRVSWHDATAFCAWADSSWPKVDGGTLSLPTEAEWELAATQSTGRGYPWSDEPPGRESLAQAAYDWGDQPFRRRGGAPPVGGFPRGHTPERGHQGPIWDLAGNVWEWCEDLDKIVSDGQPTDTEYRSLRGGSWFYVARGLRAAARSWLHPRLRDSDVGFRVVCRVPEPRA